MRDIAEVEERLRQGLFNGALEALGAVSPAEIRDPWHLALAAEALERTGRLAEAREAVRELCRREHKGKALARGLVVAGVLELENNDPAASVATLERALAVARAGSHAAEAAWSHLRLMLSRFEADPGLDLDAVCTDVRRTVEQAGEVTATVAFHVFASEMSAKRGLLPEARHHLARSRELLRRLDHPWLEGLHAISSFCVLYLDMDYPGAEHAAKQALRLSGVSGHLRSEFAAIIDLAHVWMYTGRLEDAARMLRRASTMCDLSPRCVDSVRDGLAQLELYRGNIPDGRLLVDEVLASSGPRHAYSRVWGALTRAEMLLREGLHDECRSQCETALATLPAPADRGLVLRLRLVLAEALAQSGDVAAAARVAALARQDALDSPVGLLAAINQRLARVLALGGLPLQAAALEERAQRLFSPIRNSVKAGRSVAETTEGVVARGVAQDACTRVLDRVAALFEQAGRSDLAAGEVGRLLDDLDCCRRWAVVHETGTSRVTLEHSAGMDEADLGALLADAGTIAIELGDSGTARLAVIAEPRPSAAAMAGLSAVMRLIRRSSGAFGAGAVRDGRADEASVGMRGVLHMARRVADSDVPVLLLGETGVGKEWLASRIHAWSARRDGAFIGFNCAAVGRDMLEAQLFGHRRGAFTGAVDMSPGVLRGAEGGTVLLDEIGEMPAELQVKLLRVLETGQVHPIGEPAPRPVSVRVLAATNRRLEDLLGPGGMRPDLYYRISVVRLEIPPLRERREEIVPIALDALHRAARECRRPVPALSPAAREVLVSYHWPGNVRQLVNEMRRAVALAGPRHTVETSDLSHEIASAPPVQPLAAPAHVAIDLDQALDCAVDDLERASIVRALELSHGRREQAAALLGLSRKGLYLKCQRLKLRLDS
jgi:transcriptional regulator with AAA-type ATPase domain/tetratricopeptide (TPR) repeat protein